MNRLFSAGVSAIALFAGTGLALAQDLSFDPNAVSGSITYYTHWTNYIASGDFDRWEAEFKALYPNVEDIDIIGISTYAETMSTRMATGDYGDVLDTPTTVTTEELPDFFLPLSELNGDDYYFADRWTTDGDVYALPFGVNVEGVVYNKAAFAAAGIAEVPRTYTAFKAAAEAIKANGATPLVINMGSAWPLDVWNGLAVAISGDPDFFNTLVTDPSPFDADKPYGKSYAILKDFIASGLVEEDLTGDHWQESKGWLASGQGAMWFLGNWSINQIVDEGGALAGIEDYDAGNLGYFPFPYDDSGTLNVNSGPDYAMSVNVDTDNPLLAKAWLEFLLARSDLAQIAGFIPGYKGLDPTLPQLAELDSFNPTIVEQTTPSPQFVELTNLINFSGGHGTREVMLGSDYDAAIADLNRRWSEAAQRVNR